MTVAVALFVFLAVLVCVVLASLGYAVILPVVESIP